MSLTKRIAELFHARANAILDRAEDPRETLDYSYQRQLELLATVRRGVADVATSRKRLELQLRQLSGTGSRLAGQAAEAVRIGNDDLAREALARRAAVIAQIDQLVPQRDALQAEEAKLAVAAQRLAAKVETFRTRKETIKAGYTAAQAQTRINEAVSGISEEMGDVGLAMRRAQDRTETMQARAQALDELLDSGALTDLTDGGRDDIAAALAGSQRSVDVESQLSAIKQQQRQALPAAGAEGNPR